LKVSTYTDEPTQEPDGSPFWSSLAGITAIVTSLALVGGAALALVILTSGGDSPAPEDPGAVAPAGVLGPPTAATPDPAGGVLLWSREVMLDRDGLELDESVPRRGTGDIYTISWTQVSTTGKAAITPWTRPNPPTAKECEAQVTAGSGASAPAETGSWFCVVTNEGRPAAVNLLRKSPFGSFGWIARATVWERPL
jgi:hypothetical protein